MYVDISNHASDLNESVEVGEGNKLHNQIISNDLLNDVVDKINYYKSYYN